MRILLTSLFLFAVFAFYLGNELTAFAQLAPTVPAPGPIPGASLLSYLALAALGAAPQLGSATAKSRLLLNAH
jgi:hypothetical protein